MQITFAIYKKKWMQINWTVLFFALLQSAMDVEADSNLVVTSEFTIHSVLASFRHLIGKRYDFFRNLCVFINLVDRFNEKLHVSRQVSDETAQNYFVLSLNMMNSYAYLKWLSEVYPLRVEKALWEKNFRRTVDILDDANLVMYKDQSEYNQLLLKLYVQSTGKFSINVNAVSTATNRFNGARGLPANNAALRTKPNEIFSNLMQNILSQVWPMNTETTSDFIKYLMFHVQYIHLSAYCFQTKWLACTKNLRHFLSAHCCLFFDNINQSISLFLKASYNLDKDQILKRLMKLNSSKNLILVNTPNRNSVIDENTALMSYYTKVIHYFDLNGNLEAAIELIQNALLKCHFNLASKVSLSFQF